MLCYACAALSLHVFDFSFFHLSHFVLSPLALFLLLTSASASYWAAANFVDIDWKKRSLARKALLFVPKGIVVIVFSWSATGLKHVSTWLIKIWCENENLLVIADTVTVGRYSGTVNEFMELQNRNYWN